MSDVTQAAPGWYQDHTGMTRWWDGRQWGVYAPIIVQQRPAKDVGVAYLLAILLGGFGAHNFYLGNIGAGVVQLLLWIFGWMTLAFVVGGFLLLAWGLWWLIDLFLIPGYARRANGQPVGV